MASNTEIDVAVFCGIQSVQGMPITNAYLVGFLHSRLGGRLPLTPAMEQDNLCQRASEHANRSCQRLRKRGLLRYSHKGGWVIVRSAFAQTVS